ncbi:MAG: dTMP kinase [Conexivisphaerales archaeon]
MFITFEGIDGSGKSTQAKLLKDHLLSLGYNVFLTAEPFNQNIRNILPKITDPYMEFFLLMADRVEHQKEIKKYLNQGYIVISDRYHDSSFAYQGYGRGVDTSLISLSAYFSKILFPDITFLIDIPADEALRRMKENHRMDALDEKYANYLDYIRKGFLFLSQKDSRFVVIDGNRDKDEVHKDIVNFLEPFLKKSLWMER